VITAIPASTAPMTVHHERLEVVAVFIDAPLASRG
jgi:hypothetical protein